MSQNRNQRTVTAILQLITAFCLSSFLSGCATQPYRQGDSVTPKAAYSGYDAYVLRPIVASPESLKYRTTKSGVAKLDLELKDRLSIIYPDLIVSKDSAPANALLIEPTVERMKFIDNRWTVASVFRGASWVELNVIIRESGNNKIIEQKTFKGRANGFKGFMTFGASDYSMLSGLVWDLFYCIADNQQ